MTAGTSAASPGHACHVDVWRIALATTSRDDAAALALLSAPERARHERYLDAAAAREFAAARAALRRLLGLRLGVAPALLRIERGPHGKPFLPEHAGTRFNAAHAGGFAAIAVSGDAEVGIDLELAAAFDARRPLREVVCNDAERRWLAAHPEQADRALGRLWTRKEALLKALGTGLAIEPAGVDLSAQIRASGGTIAIAAPGGMVAATLAWTDVALGDDVLCSAAAVVAHAGATLVVARRG